MNEDGSFSMNDYLQAIFNEFDYNGNGTLDAAELVAALNKLGCKSSVGELDTDGDGVISFDEFKVLAAVIERHTHAIFKQPNTSKCIDLLTADDEMIDKAKGIVKQLVSTMRVDDNTLLKEFKKLDADSDARLTKREMKLVRTAPNAMRDCCECDCCGPPRYARAVMHTDDDVWSVRVCRTFQIIKKHIPQATMSEQQIMLYTLYNVADINRDDAISFDEFKAVMQYK